MDDNTKYTMDEILILANKSTYLTNKQKACIGNYINAAFQAIYNAATNEYGGQSLTKSNEIDYWEYNYDRLMKIIIYPDDDLLEWNSKNPGYGMDFS